MTGRRGEGDDAAAPILTREETLRRFGGSGEGIVVFTNGVFDLLHSGHVHCLERAASLGDRLVVGVNGDSSARRVKGAGRPVQPAADRAALVASLRPVDAVTVFDEETPLELVRALVPDVLVKGDDYREADVVGADEVKAAGGRVELVPRLEGRSTSRLLRRAAEAAEQGDGGGAEGASPGAQRRESSGARGGVEVELHPELRPAEPGNPVPDGREVLVATRSPHKLEEIRELLSDSRYEVVSLQELGEEERAEEEGIERFDSFEENALAKARYFHERTGRFTMADDSGLCVDALDGGPGVHTKRFAPEQLARRWGRDEANNRYLLEKLHGVTDDERTARYRCAIAAYDGSRCRIWTGTVEGRIARDPRGTGGFGYDPLFIVPEHGKTFAELPAEVKNSMSHRARALEEVRRWFQELSERGR